MADNGTTAYDSNGENDDWVELYNTTSTAKDLTGLYLSDDLSNLIKWPIPTGTSINANDVLVIWTDEDSEQSGLHANFKLSGSGESVYLTNGSVIYDQVDFGVQTEDISYARCPDGGTFTFAAPTFDALNNCQLSVADAEQLEVMIYPNPSGSVFTIKMDLAAEYVVHDLSGRTILSGSIESQLTTLDAQSWNAGTYLVSIYDNSGKTRTIKLIKQ
jgi:hypothetical protein